jgi:hypothetical protein
MFGTEFALHATEILPDEMGLPSDLDRIEPGPFLAVILSGIDREQLTGHDRVSLLQARTRLISHLQAELLADVRSVSRSVSELVSERSDDPFIRAESGFYDTATEISAALTLTRRASELQVGMAFALCDRLPAVLKALSEGDIDLPRARVLADQTVHLPQELARRVCDQALERASSQTTGQLRARMQRLIITIDPASAKDRYEKKLTERKVVCESTDAGTASIHATDLPADRANQAMCRINRLAKTAKRKGDRRGIDQIRADIFLDLLCGTHPEQTGSGTDRGTVDIRVDLTTLLGMDDQPGEIPGWGPVIADLCRQIIENHPQMKYRVAVTHHDQLIDILTTRRRPNTAQKRLVEIREPECVFPTCRTGSPDCDLDHHHTWTETKQTRTDDLEPLCRYHHQQKHANWKLKKINPNTYIWTSPLGHTYTTGPDPP